jgi:RNA-directed DNA polymerase
MSTGQQPMYKWQDLPWKQYERAVFKLQKRIYQASLKGDNKTVHKLQRLLLNSWSAKCLAVRRVTQDNRGKHTAGIDGVKSLNPKQRLQLAATLSLSQTAKPVRRVWIPKPGKTEKRPLGIPTLRNRAEQALAKLALEPEWEARFEPNSYGFRPGRSAHDAIEAIFKSLCHQSKFALDADIRKCFDQISHQAVLQKLHTFATLRRAIRAWLKAGVMEDQQLFPTTEGSPQGGVISPLIANVALHGIETLVVSKHPKAKVIRYADDMVILHPEEQIIIHIQQMVTEWLKDINLELNLEKTRIVHTLNQTSEPPGFDFLGFNVRQYPVGKTHTRRRRIEKQPAFKTFIKPSQKAIQRHQQSLKKIIQANLMTDQARLIGQLNPVISGWTNYYTTVVSKKTFVKLDCLTFVKLVRWAKRRHNTKSWKWLVHKYWHPERGRWTFAPVDGIPLLRHSQTSLRRHVKVKGSKSPFDGDWIYWSQRQARYPGKPKRVTFLLRKQKGRCNRCGLYLRDEDQLEVDHILSTSRGGKDEYCNLQLLHAHCHHRKSTAERKAV